MTDKIQNEEKLIEVIGQAEQAAHTLGLADMALTAAGVEPLAVVIAHFGSVSSLIASMASCKEQSIESAEKLIDDLVRGFLKSKLREDMARANEACAELASMMADSAIEKAKAD